MGASIRGSGLIHFGPYCWGEPGTSLGLSRHQSVQLPDLLTLPWAQRLKRSGELVGFCLEPVVPALGKAASDLQGGGDSLPHLLSPGHIFRPQDLRSLVSPLSLASPSRSRALHFSRPSPGPKASLCLSIRQAWLMPLPALPPPRKACNSLGSHQRSAKTIPDPAQSRHLILSSLSSR